MMKRGGGVSAAKNVSEEMKKGWIDSRHIYVAGCFAPARLLQ